MLWSFVADFYCSKLLLAIEVDGDIHKTKETYDIQRTDKINNLWIMVIRYTNSEVLNHIEQVEEDLQLKIKDREKYINQNFKNTL
jgi:very-short-patch-repair endonuclease